MKKLVTGATGFIGSAIIRELLNRGEEVRVLIRKTSDMRNIAGLNVDIAYGDIRDEESMKSALQGCDVLYQTAGHFAHWVPDKQILYDVNVNGTRIALNAALEVGVEKVVYTSSCVTIGAHGVKTPAKEEAAFNLSDTGDHYSKSKYLGELEARKCVDKGLHVIIVNPTVVIGVRDRKPTPSGKMIIDVANGALPGYIDGGLNIIDVEDVAVGHIHAAQKGRSGERYLLGNENISILNYFKLICEVAGVSSPQIKIPHAAAVVLGHLSELVSIFTNKPPVTTASVVEIGKKFEWYDCSKAISELGLPQTPIRITIEKAIKWFRENGYIKKSFL